MKTEDDLLPPGAEPGTVPTDLDQSTGLERFEILGKMQGIDVFDMRPLDASRKGMSDFILETGGFGIRIRSRRIGDSYGLWEKWDTKQPGRARIHSHPILGRTEWQCVGDDTKQQLTHLFATGTLDNPIVVKSAGDEQFAGCTGYPADSHVTLWLSVRLFPLLPLPLPTPSFPPSPLLSLRPPPLNLSPAR